MPTGSRSKKSLRALAIIILVPIVLYVLLWTGAYWFADRFVERYFFNRERPFGREWSCEDRGAAGFITTLKYRCTGVMLDLASTSGPTQVGMKELQLSYSVLHPLTIKADFQAPFYMRLPNRQVNIEAHWKSMIVKTSVSFSRVLSLDISGQDVSAKIPELEGQNTYALQSLLLSSSLKPIRTQSSQNAEIYLSLSGFSAPPLDRWFGDTRTANISTSFQIAHVDQLIRGTMTDRLDSWRVQNGSLNFSQFRFERSRLTVEGAGALSVDVMRRPAGQISGRASGLTMLLKAIGLPESSAGGGGLLGGMLRRRPPESELVAETPGRMVPFSFSMKDGSVWLGPLRTPVKLKPLI